MLRLRMITLVTFVAFPFWISAAEISEVGRSASLPSITVIPLAEIPGVDKLVSIELPSMEVQGYPFPDLFSPDATAGERETEEGFVLGETESKGRLTFVISIFFTLGALLKYLSSPAFYETLSNVSCMLFAIGHEGRD
jgi:hypothetical protein